MATNRDPIVMEEITQSDGSIVARVQFLSAGRTLPRKIDAKIGERTFRIDKDAQALLKQANQRLNAALQSFGGGRARADVKPFDVSMAIYLYTRKNKAPELPMTEIVIDGAVMRSIAKKFVG